MTCPIAASDWRKVRQWAEDRIEEMRRRLENDLGDIDTAVLRGRIRELRALLEWGEPTQPPQIIASPSYDAGY